MRVFSGLIAVLTMVALSGSVTEAQTIKKGTISGVILTQSVNVPVSASADVFTTDAAVKGARWLILTQVCVEDEGDLTFDGNTMGQIVLDNECTTAPPWAPLDTRPVCAVGPPRRDRATDWIR